MSFNWTRNRPLNALLILPCLGGMLLAAVAGRAPQVAEAKRPDIVVIQTDDMTSAMLHSTYINRRGKQALTMPNRKWAWCGNIAIGTAVRNKSAAHK